MAQDWNCNTIIAFGSKEVGWALCVEDNVFEYVNQDGDVDKVLEDVFQLIWFELEIEPSWIFQEEFVTRLVVQELTVQERSIQESSLHWRCTV